MSDSPRGLKINPIRKRLLQAANHLAHTRKVSYQLVQLRAQAKEKIATMEKLIAKIEERLREVQQ